MNSTLDFTEFSDASLEHWKKLLAKELGEKPYESLIWTDASGNEMQPYYTQSSTSFQFAQFPKSWLIHQAPAPCTNQSIVECLMGGANSIGLPKGANAAQVKALLAGVFLEAASVTLQPEANAAEQLEALISLAKENNVPASQISGTMATSPTHEHFRQEVAACVKLQTQAGSKLRLVSIPAYTMHEQGGTALLELRYALAAGHEALLALIDAGLSAADAADAIEFHFAASNSFFSEIAKFRAFRVLWNTLAGEYTKQAESPCHIAVSTSLYLQSAFDGYTNLLRATTQAMSAVLGGAEKVEVRPFNAAVKAESSASLRWARNIQHLLIEESYLPGLGDVAQGAYYLEELTAQYVAKAWSAFQTDENAGGFYAIHAALYQEAEAAHVYNTEQVGVGLRVVLGVNKYPNTMEQVSGGGLPGRLSSQLEERIATKIQA